MGLEANMTPLGLGVRLFCLGVHEPHNSTTIYFPISHHISPLNCANYYYKGIQCVDNIWDSVGNWLRIQTQWCQLIDSVLNITLLGE